MEKELEKYFDRLWPICRSITGNGLRQSLKILQEIIPLCIHEVPSGTKVFDWEIPDEWNIRDAYLVTPKGKITAEFKKNNLHLVNYSVPVHRDMEFSELEEHLYYIKEMPAAVPYVTSYYKKNWGFAISYNEFKKLPRKGKYKVFIDSELKPGSLTYGDLVIPGKTKREILFSTYICHPSMANNELSGPLAAAFLYKKIMELPARKYTYRFVFAPETIGAIAYLHRNGFHLVDHLEAGFVITCCGDKGKFNYKRSKRGNSLADRAAGHVLGSRKVSYKVRDFSIGGSDERQYCSAGFNLPVGAIMRTPYKEYRQYHTSLDNKKIISFSHLRATVDLCFDIVKTLELNEKYRVKMPYGELQLGKRGLYPERGGFMKKHDDVLNLLHFICYADGTLDLIDIAEKRNLPVLAFESTVKSCIEKDIINA